MNQKFFHLYILIFVLFIVSSSLKAQTDFYWEPFNDGLEGGNVTAVVIDPNNPENIFIGTLGGGIYYSSDSGKTWNQRNRGLTTWNVLSLLLRNDQQMFAGTTQGIFQIAIDDLKNGSRNWKEFEDTNNILSGYSILKLRDSRNDEELNFYAIARKNVENAINQLLLIDNTSVEVFDEFPDDNVEVYDVAPKRQTNLTGKDEFKKMCIGTNNGLYVYYPDRNDFHHCFNGENVHSLALRTDGSSVYVFIGKDDGLYYSSNYDLVCSSFNNRVDDINEKIVMIEPFLSTTTNFFHLYAISEGGKIYDCSDPLQGRCSEMPAPPGFLNTLNAVDTDINYPVAGTPCGFYYFNGTNWIQQNSNIFAHKFNTWIHGFSHNQLWTGTEGGLFYNELNNNVTPWENEIVKGQIRALANQPDSIHLLAGMGDKTISRIKKNDRTTKSDVFPNFKNQHFDLINALLPLSDDIVYAGTNKHLYKIDGDDIKEVLHGNIKAIEIDALLQTLYCLESYSIIWQKISDQNPTSWNFTDKKIHSIKINPNNNFLYAATSKGIWFHEPPSASWQPDGLENESVLQIDIIPTITPFQGVIYALYDKPNAMPTIRRNIIPVAECSLKKNSEETIENEFEPGISFVVNHQEPSKVYLETEKNGIYRYTFQHAVPTINILDSSYDFKEVIKGNQVEWLAVTVKNENYFIPLVVTWECLVPSDIKADFDNPLIIQPEDDTIEIKIQFSPQTWGSQQSQIDLRICDIFRNHEFDTTLPFDLQGRGVWGEFDIDKSEENADVITVQFNDTHVGDSSTKEIPWKVIGNKDLQNFDRTGPENITIFEVTGDPVGPIVNVGTSGTIKITFKPTSIETSTVPIQYTYIFPVNDIDSPEYSKTIQLIGEGKEGKLQAEPTALDFGEVPVLTPRKRGVKLTNIGNIPVTINSMRLLINDEIFENLTCAPIPIAHQETKEIELEFRPQDIINYSNTLRIEYTDEMNFKDNLEVLLSGKGVTNCTKPTPPDTIAFGDIHINCLPSEPETLTIKNICDHSIYIDSLVHKNNFFVIENIEKMKFSIEIPPSDSILVKIYCKKIEQIGLQKDTLYIHFHHGEISGTPDIQLSANVVSAKPVVSPLFSEKAVEVGSCDTVQFHLRNEGNISLHYEIITPPSLDVYKIISETEGTIPSEQNNQKDLIVEFCPVDLINYPDKIEIKFWDTDDDCSIDDTVSIDLNCKGVDCTPPIITLLKPKTQNVIQTLTPERLKTNDFKIVAEITDELSEVDSNSVFLSIREAGTLNWDKINTFKNTNSTYTWDNLSDYITSRGVEFFIEANDNWKPPNCACSASGKDFDYYSLPILIPENFQPRHTNSQTLKFHKGNAREDYRMISIPFNIANNAGSARKILGQSINTNYNGEEWRCADFISSTNKYQFLDEKANFNLEPTRAFFLLIADKTATANTFLSVPAGTTQVTNELFTFKLNQGWNLIANPFDFPIPCTNICLLINGIKTEIKELLKYEGYWPAVTDYIYPWTGYAIFTNNTNDSLQISPNLEYPIKPTVLAKPSLETVLQWHLGIEARCEQARDLRNMAGVAEDALLEYDPLDRPEPPPIGEYVMFSFPHSEWEYACEFFETDIRPPQAAGNYWDFFVHTNIPNSNVELTFKNIQSVPAEYDLALVSEALQRYQDLRLDPRFIYNSTTAQTGQKFRLIVGKKEFIKENNLNVNLLPKDFRLTSNFPNPFTGTTYIRYELPKEETVRICVYNVLGKVVYTLKNVQEHPAGTYVIPWNGQNQQGELVGNGVYFCQFTTSLYSKTIKMILVK